MNTAIIHLRNPRWPPYLGSIIGEIKKTDVTSKLLHVLCSFWCLPLGFPTQGIYQKQCRMNTAIIYLKNPRWPPRLGSIIGEIKKMDITSKLLHVLCSFRCLPLGFPTQGIYQKQCRMNTAIIYLKNPRWPPRLGSIIGEIKKMDITSKLLHVLCSFRCLPLGFPTQGIY